MSRGPIALLIGLVGLTAYLIVVLALGDFVIQWHWTIQALYFTFAGIAWVWPAKRLIYWSAGK